MPSDEKLLEEIRKRFDYCVRAWEDIRAEGRTDMRYVAGDPWDPAERKARKAAGTPCLSMDELSQYINQKVNDVRMNKRAVSVHPAGDGATDDTAEFRAGLIRQIEYRSNAQAAYATGFENVLQRSYGAWRVSTRYVKDEDPEQEIVIRRIPNPDTVLVDPDAKEADFSDMGYGFILDRMPTEKFREKWPRAEIQSFSGEHVDLAPSWIQIDGEYSQVQVAEYWKRSSVSRRRLYTHQGASVYLDEIEGAKMDGKTAIGPDGQAIPGIANHREVKQSTVCQYITNGIEILEINEWPGRYIPIVVPVGKEIWLDDGSGPQRKLFSLIRLARDPYMYYCYLRTCQAVLAGMSPKTPFIGYEGQFEGHEGEWENVNRVPLPYLQVKATTDATGATVLPIPQRQLFEPPIQGLEMAAESAKRSIQSAMGMFNTSVGRQDSAAKSGVAIRALDQQSDQGNFHFIDNFDRALQYTGRIINDLIPHIYDTPRDLGIRKPDETYQMVRANDPQWVDPQSQQPTHLRTDQGDHDVTISAGPSFESQRAEAQDFANQLSQNQQIFPLIADLVVRLRNLGPIGDQIAERLTPPQFRTDQNGQQPLPPQVQQQMEQGKQMISQLSQTVHQLQNQLDAKMPEQQTKIQIAEMQEVTKRQNIEATVRIAELNAGMQAAATQLEQQMVAIQHSIDTMLASRVQDHAENVSDQQMQQAAQEQQQAQAQQQPQVSQ